MIDWAERYKRTNRVCGFDAVRVKALKWTVAPVATGRYRSFEVRGWPSAYYADGLSAVTLYADKAYSKSASEDGSATIEIRIADWSVGKTPEGRKVNGAFKWRRLTQRAKTLRQAKQMAEAFVTAHPEYAP